MIIILCVDDNGGMMFNKRRLSRDKVLYEKIIDITKESTLWLNNYSSSLFEGMNSSHIRVSESFIENATKGDFCFVEDTGLKSFENRIEKIILFKWNRVYPKDLFFDINISGWKLIESSEFAGNSHKKITMEVYEK